LTEASRIRRLERQAIRERAFGHGAESGKPTARSIPEFLVPVPLKKTIPGEETYAEQHIGTPYASRSWHKPIDAMYSPRQDVFMVINGHHRVAEAKRAGLKDLLGWVSLYADDRGFGSLSNEELARKRLED